MPGSVGPTSVILALVLGSVAAERLILQQLDLETSGKVGARAAAVGRVEAHLFGAAEEAGLLGSEAWLSGVDQHDQEVLRALEAAAKSSQVVQHFASLAPSDGSAGTAAPESVPAAYDQDGFCPLQSEADRRAAAVKVGGALQRVFQQHAETKAWIWKAGEERPINPSTDTELKTTHPRGLSLVTPNWYDIQETLEIWQMLPAFAATDGGNRTTFFNNVARSNCWGPSPLGDGPMIFKYSEVVPRLTDPRQARGFYTATVPQSVKYFNRDMIIFQDGPSHRKIRSLLNSAGFARRYPVDAELVHASSASGTDLASVVAVALPVLFDALWGAVPDKDVMEAAKVYGSYGKFAVFGAKIDGVLSPIGISDKIRQARKTISEWVATTPFARVLMAAKVEFAPGDVFFHDVPKFLQNVVDLGLFAGLLGTTDMAHKCVLNQERDAAHRELFRADPELYLIELMRFDSAVTSVTELLREDEAVLLQGRRLTFAKGTPRQLVLATANRDPAKFKDPGLFNPLREELGDSVAWNGRAQDVEARDEEKAPRGCPGYCLSLKVATVVCAKMTGSFDDLLAKGKIGGEVRCSNFKHEAGKGDSAPLWHPPVGKTYPSPTAAAQSLGEVSVKVGRYCRAEESYLGEFESLSRCVQAVQRSGGKYFYFGSGTLTRGYCYLSYTVSRSCPEGFAHGFYDFYDIESVPASDWSPCNIGAVMVAVGGGPAAQRGSGLLYRRQYADPSSATLAAAETREAGRSCRLEYRLHCRKDRVGLKTFEACGPSGDLKEVAERWADKDHRALAPLSAPSQATSFSVLAPTHPPLPGGEGPLRPLLTARTVTLTEAYASCPSWLKTALQALGAASTASYGTLGRFIPKGESSHPLAVALGKSKDSSILDPTVFGDFTVGMVVCVVHLFLKTMEGAKLAPAERIVLPTRMEFSDRYASHGSLFSPVRDIDLTMDPKFDLTVECVFDALRKVDLQDHIDSGENEWWRILGSDYANQPHHCPKNQLKCTKKEFTMGVFDYRTKDGDPVYPAEQLDFSKHFLDGRGLWGDAAERFLAFGHLGSHMLRPLRDGAPSLGGETAAYAVESLDIAGLPRRRGFAAPGANMYFSREGMPLMVRTAAGEEVWKHATDEGTWQYWKFHWRSSVFLRVTLIDHLYATHFAVAGKLATAAREALPAEHTLRRILTMFTSGSIDVNNNALTQLVDSRGLLHRATPYSDWHAVILAARASVPSLRKRYGPFFDEGGLPEELKELPYYQDGKLLADALRDLASGWARLYSADWCGADGTVADGHVLSFFEQLRGMSVDGYNIDDDREWMGLHAAEGRIACAGIERFLAVMFFAVTGWHRHVGTIADIGSDADFASWSWRDGDASGLPRNHLDMALVVAFTAKIMPKLLQDYTFLARGLPREAEAEGLLKDFHDAMRANGEEIDRRNARRELPYLQMHPGEVECSVAV